MNHRRELAPRDQMGKHGLGLQAGATATETFRQCASLVGGAGTAWSSSAVAGSHMRIDGGAASTGYLTAKAGS